MRIILFVVYIIIGVALAASHHYFANLDAIRAAEHRGRFC
jgi:hypothetical protein